MENTLRGIEFTFVVIFAVLIGGTLVLLHFRDGTKPARALAEAGAAFGGTVLLGIAILSFFHN